MKKTLVVKLKTHTHILIIILVRVYVDLLGVSSFTFGETKGGMID